MKTSPTLFYRIACASGCVLLSIALLALFGGEQARTAVRRNVAVSALPSDNLIEVGGGCVRLTESTPTSDRCLAAGSFVAPQRLKVVSYNIRWRSGDELQEIITLFKSDKEIGGAGIIGLQEVDRKRRRSGHTNTARTIAEALEMNYAWAAPPLPERKAKDALEEETGVAILSSYPLTDVAKILLPHEGPGGRRRVAVGATVHLGSTRVRVYSVHAETRVSVDERTEQLQAVLDELARHPKDIPAIVLGDFNSWQPDSKRDLVRLFTARDFTTPFPPGQPTFRHMFVKMRLDWIWLRGFAPATSHGIARHIKISDHYPLWLDAPTPPKQGIRAEGG